MRLLVLSNGAGEDAIAASILENFQDKSGVSVFPLVGAGAAFAQQYPVLGLGDAPPSQGLSNQSWRLWWRDLRHGLIGRILHQRALLRSLRSEVRAVLAVGDLFPCCLAALAGLRPVYFVGTAKSVYHHRYSALERWLLRGCVRESVVRDLPTADFLGQHQLVAHYLGNPMMDETVPRGLDLGLEGQLTLALFPGSRAQAPEELPRQLRIWARVWQEFPCRAAVAVAEGLDLSLLVQHCRGWKLHLSQQEQGRVGWLSHPQLPEVLLIRRALGDLLARSQLALGQAGTAHEQAAGAGLPVVSLHPRPTGPLGWYRGRQKGLLGEALLLVSEDEQEAAQCLLALWRDPQERARRGQIGRQRMGEPGGARAIAAWMESRLAQ